MAHLCLDKLISDDGLAWQRYEQGKSVVKLSPTSNCDLREQWQVGVSALPGWGQTADCVMGTPKWGCADIDMLESLV